MLEKLKNKNNLMMFIIVIVFILLVLLVVVSTIFNFDGSKFKKEYEKLNGIEDDRGKTYLKVDITSNNKIKYASTSKIVNIFEEEKDAVIFFGYPSCHYCRTAAKVLTDVASKTKLKKIYYLDTEYITFEKDDKLIELIGSDFFKGSNKNKKINVPLVLFIVDGDIVSYHEGTLSTHNNAYEPMSKDQIEGLREIYKHGIDDVLNG